MSAFDSMIAQGFPARLAAQMTAEVLAQYGEEPCTREQAAAHEAGHWVIGDTLGLAPHRRLRLFKWRGRWLGDNIEVHPTEVHILEDLDGYQVRALQTIGGFVGELVAGHGHPASSVDERASLLASCCTLARLHGGQPETLFVSAVVVAVEIIQTRREAFDLVRHHLARERRILRPQLDRLSQPDPAPWLRRWRELAATPLNS